MKVVIIGSGPAGIVVSHVVKKLKPDSEVTVIGKEKNIVVRCSEPYAISGDTEVDKIIKPDEVITSVGADLVRDEVVEIGKTVKTKSGNEFEFDYLVFATGAKPFIPPIEGAELKNVFTLRTAEDARKIRESLSEAKRIVIVGGGMIGVELASLLAGRFDVTIIELLPKIFYTSYDEEFCSEVEKLLKEKGINLLTGKKVEKILGDEKVKSVIVEGEEIETDIVLLFTGIRPEDELAKKMGIETGKFGIKTDKHMKTNLDNVYAAGDCVESVSIVTGKPTPSGLVSTAISQAKVAAMNICGVEAEFPGVTNPSITKIFDITLGRAGFIQKQAESEGIKVKVGTFEGLTKYDTQKDPRPMKVKLIFNEKEEVIGGEILANGNFVAPFIDFLSFAISKKITCNELKNLQYSAHPELTPLPFFHPIVSACEQIE